MSVVVWDGKTLAADRQGTQGDLRVRSTKIKRLKSGDVVAWTGEHSAGLILADWYEDGEDPAKWPTFQAGEDWCRLIVASRGRVWMYERLPARTYAEGRCAAWGSGRDFAFGAMAMGADAVKAVRVASGFCTSCGLGVDSFKVTLR